MTRSVRSQAGLRASALKIRRTSSCPPRTSDGGWSSFDPTAPPTSTKFGSIHATFGSVPAWAAEKKSANEYGDENGRTLSNVRGSKSRSIAQIVAKSSCVYQRHVAPATSRWRTNDGRGEIGGGGGVG